MTLELLVPHGGLYQELICNSHLITNSGGFLVARRTGYSKTEHLHAEYMNMLHAQL